MRLLHAFLRSLLTASSLDGNGRTFETTCASKVLLQGMEQKAKADCSWKNGSLHAANSPCQRMNLQES